MATPDEVIETTIKGVGTEAISSPAQDGDWVVENICLATGNEQYLVEKGKFHQYCHDPVTVLSKPNYLRFIPTGKMINYFIVSKTESVFTFINSWEKNSCCVPVTLLFSLFVSRKNFITYQNNHSFLTIFWLLRKKYLIKVSVISNYNRGSFLFYFLIGNPIKVNLDILYLPYNR